MYLSLREVWFARLRFLLVGGVLALMAILIVTISGLSAGLVNDGVSSLKAMPASAVAFENGTKTDSAFTRSVVDVAKADAWAQQKDVAKATPLGLSIVNARNEDGTPVDLTLFGIDSRGFLAPRSDGAPVPRPASESARTAARTAARPTPTEHGIVVSRTLKDAGVKRGDVLTIERLGTKLTVLGFTEDQRTFGHVDVAYLPLDVWQEIHAGARATEGARPGSYREASVIVAQAEQGKTLDLAAGSHATGTDARPLDETFNSSPGYEAESMTMSLIQWFLYAIAALVTGAFFLVWTIQRSGDIAVMRAMGAGRGFLLRDGLGQAVLVLVSSILIGTALAVALGSWLQTTAMPFSLEAGPVATGALLLFVFGLIGATVAVLRVTRTDPLAALGENR